MSPFSSPLPQENAPFYLVFLSGNISKCSGCNNKYNKPANPPCDLIVQHQEWRFYTPNSGVEQQSKFSNAYYRLNLLCIQRKWPYFNLPHIVISNDVKLRLTEVHYNLLEFLLTEHLLKSIFC